jgi:hypothetical protein
MMDAEAKIPDPVPTPDLEKLRLYPPNCCRIKLTPYRATNHERTYSSRERDLLANYEEKLKTGRP